MPVLKPVRGIRLNKSHPLARGLVGYWLLNEGSGNKVFDLSGNGNTGTRGGTGIIWASGKFGRAQQFNGADDNITLGNNKFDFLASNSYTISVWVNADFLPTDTDYDRIIDLEGRIGYIQAISSTWVFGIYNGAALKEVSSATNYATGQWVHIVGVYDKGADTVTIAIDGIIRATTGTVGTPDNSQDRNCLIGCAYDASLRFFDGLIDHAMIFNRALSASEIALLYREPFCMFDRASCILKFQISNFKFLAGTAAGTSNVSTVLGLRRGLTASTGGFTAVDGSLGIMGESPPEMESTVRHPVESWLREALFNGMTANAFKLGTSLSLGWFWVRVTGCSALYRGESGGMGGIGGVDFANILTASERDVSEISPPSYIPHNSGSTYFYVVRRFNNCGYQEHTLAAAVKVSIGSSGELAEPQPNNTSSSIVEQVASNKVRLTWFYCPLEQGSKPVSFNVYYDERTGQIDYQNPLATIGYKGRKFYSFQSSALEAGGHLFAIRAEDAGGIENISLAQLKIQLDSLNPDAIDILRAEAV